MDNVSPSPTGPAATIGALITPALLMLGSTSLVASALVRMARVVDRARVLAGVLHDGKAASLGITEDVLRAWLRSHGARARYVEQAIASLYGAVVIFVASGLAIALDRALGGALSWLPESLAILGTMLLLAGGGWMVAESRLSGRQIQDEIRIALARPKEQTS
jgi:hypothetical protein